MRKLVLIGLFLGGLGVAPSALACDPHGRGTQVVIELEVPSDLATKQSQTFLLEATILDGKATAEETAASNASATAKLKRRQAAAIRVQAFQAPTASQAGLFARVDKLDAEAASNDSAAATFQVRAKAIRTRARSLRALSTRVLTSGAVSAQVLPRVQLPAVPAGFLVQGALRSLDAAPKAAAVPRMAVAAI